MNIIYTARRFVMMSLLALLTPIVLFGPHAYAESYVAGQIGVTLPQSLNNGTVTQDGIGGLDISDQPLKNSAMVGAKLGHYFTRARWIGIETGVSYSTPHIKEGSLTFSGPGGSATTPSLSGIHQRMIIWDAACHLPLSRLPAPTLHRNRPLSILCKLKWPLPHLQDNRPPPSASTLKEVYGTTSRVNGPCSGKANTTTPA